MRSLAFLLVVALVASPSACTFLLLGAGAGTDRMDDARPADVVTVDKGTPIEVQPRGAPIVRGKYQGKEANQLLIEGDDGTVQRVPLASIERARVRVGSYWIAGVLTGLAVDAVLVLVALYSFPTSG